MALIDRAPAPSRKGTICAVERLIDRMEAGDQATLEEWLEDPAYQGTAIAKALNAEFDTGISGYTVQRHRRGDCRCAR